MDADADAFSDDPFFIFMFMPLFLLLFLPPLFLLFFVFATTREYIFRLVETRACTGDIDADADADEFEFSHPSLPKARVLLSVFFFLPSRGVDVRGVRFRLLLRTRTLLLHAS